MKSGTTRKIVKGQWRSKVIMDMNQVPNEKKNHLKKVRNVWKLIIMEMVDYINK